MMQQNSGELHVHQIVTLLRRRRGFIFLCMIAGAALAYGVGTIIPPRYTAKAQILRETELRDGVEVADEAAVDTLVELLLSPSHLRGLAASFADDPLPDSAEKMPDFEALLEKLNVFKERRSRLIGVTFVSTDPALSAEVANRAVGLYLSGVAEHEDAVRSETLEALTASLADAHKTLVEAESALRAHRVAYGVTDETRRDEAAVQIADLNTQLRISRSELADVEARGAPTEPRVADAPSDGGTGGRPPENVLLSSVTEAHAGTAPAPRNGPEVILARQAAVYRARIDEIEGRLATLRKASQEAGDADVRLQELEREAHAAGQVYETLLRKTAELTDSPPVRAPVRIVSHAVPPERPSSPNPVLFIFPALMASGLLSGLGAIMLERMDQRLRSERDVQEALGVPCIGLTPRLRRRRKTPPGELLPKDPFNGYTEAIRGIVAAAARFDRREGRPVVHLFTGSATGVGTTTTAIGFAVYAARLRRRVLLIDLDFRNPSVMRTLGEAVDANSARSPDPAAEGYVIAAAPELGIDVMPAPRLDVDPLEILSRQEFHDLLGRLRRIYDVIVIDSAPVAAATETRLLSLAADQVIFAVEWGVTEAPEAREGIRKLRAARPGETVPISVAVTQVNMRLHQRRRYGASAQAPEEGAAA